MLFDLKQVLTKSVNARGCFYFSHLVFIVRKDRAAGCLCPLHKLKHLI